MQLSFKLFVVLFTVVGTVSIAANPCLSGYGKYDWGACWDCADSGENKGLCCGAIYRHYHGDEYSDDDEDSLYVCHEIGETCWVGYGWCYPGLVCDGPDWSKSTCTLPTDNPEAHAASSLLSKMRAKKSKKRS